MDGNRSRQGVHNNSLDVCEITLTVKRLRRTMHQEAEWHIQYNGDDDTIFTCMDAQKNTKVEMIRC